MTINYVVKLKLARYYVAGLGLVEVPIGVTRLKKGAWSISATRFPDLAISLFADSDYKKGAVGALLAALDMVDGYVTKRLRALETEEREIKRTKLEQVGISYYTVMDKGLHIHRFSVSTPGDDIPNKTVYIGNDNTWVVNYEIAFLKAVDIRHAWERQRNIDHHWNGLNTVQMEQPA
jgi:hypothetical protein